MNWSYDSVLEKCVYLLVEPQIQEEQRSSLSWSWNNRSVLNPLEDIREYVGFVQSVYVYFLDLWISGGCWTLPGFPFVADSVHGRTGTARWIVIKVQILAK